MSLSANVLLDLVPYADCSPKQAKLALSPSTPSTVEFLSMLPQIIGVQISLSPLEYEAAYALLVRPPPPLRCALSLIFLQVEYADGQQCFYRVLPSAEDFTCDIALEQGNWSEPCTIHLSLIRLTQLPHNAIASTLRGSNAPQEGLDFTVISSKLSLRIHPMNARK